MEILAGILGLLASFVLLMSVIRMLEKKLKDDGGVDLATWFLFGGIVLFAAIGFLGGVYLIFFH